MLKLKYQILLFALLLFSIAKANTIVSAEYFWNTDPGIENGIAITVLTQSDSVNFNVPISTAGLKAGYQVLYIRTKDNTGKWSLSEGRVMYLQPTIFAAEYFWNTDPGIGNGTALSAFVADDSINIARSISSVGLKKGYHTLYTRTKDTDGIWSLSEGRIIYVQPKITEAEYFWDTDPGVDLATKTAAFTATDSLNFNPSISTIGLKKGYHTLYTRTKDTDGKWSLSEGRNIYINSKVLASEYFWDTDPGQGSGIAMSSFAAADSINTNTSISTTGVRSGYHTFCTRTKDVDNTWSLSEGRTMYVQPKIGGAGESFWDTDPGFGNGLPIFVFYPSDSINTTYTMSTAGLSYGLHTFYTRFRTTENKWSLAEGRQLNIVKGLIAAEYYFDSDPGHGNGTALSVMPGATINYSGNITLPVLSAGLHKLYIRTLDNEGKWSLPEPLPIYIKALNANATQIVASEYYYDVDPGFGNASTLAVSPAGTINISTGVTVPVLSAGMHKLYLRTQDNNGKWSLPEMRALYIQNAKGASTQIVASEFYFDSEPGFGNGTPLAVTPSGTINMNATVTLPTLSAGTHQLYLRTKDNNGTWSHPEKRNIYINSKQPNASQIIAAEYFVDTDPGVGSAASLAITAPAATVNECARITLPSLSVGSHKLFIRTKDNNNVWSLQEPRTFTGIAAPNISINPSGPVMICPGGSVNLMATATGGFGSYQWYNGCNLISGATSALLTVSVAGTYTVTVINGAQVQSATVVVTVAPAPLLAVTNNSAVCGSAFLNFNVNVTNALLPVTYLWSGPNSFSSTLQNPATPNVVAAIGTYTVTVTVTNGCTASAQTTISSNTAAPSAAITPSSGTLTCTTTSISLVASGGVSYVWDDNANSATRVVSAAGTYTVTVTGSNGCTATAQAVITSIITAPTAVITPSSGTLTCTTTSISLVASGGTSYVWDDNSISATRVVSAAGTYTVTVTGSNGCTATAQAVITSIITAPTAVITPSSGTLTCTTTSISLVASGGTSYVWDDNSISATRVVSAAGNYTVTVTDAANGCTSSTSVTIGSNTTAPTAVITPASGTLTCTTTSISLVASGGTSYVWDDNSISATRVVSAAGTYTVTVTDAANGCTSMTTATIGSNTTAPTAVITPSTGTLTCTTTSISLVASGGTSYVWDDNSISATRVVSAAGTYTVTVTDAANGCTSMTTATIGSNTTAPSAVITPASGTLTCTTTSISLVASGGTSYFWNDNSTSATRVVSAAGTYTVTVTDGANGCTSMTTATIGSNTTAPTAVITPSTGTLTCTTTSISLVASGGTSYVWDDNSISATRVVSAAGTYTVTVTDGANGCTSMTTATIVSNTTAPTAAITPSSGSLTCTTTSISLVASGGSSYVWDDNSISATRVVSAAGTYTVTVTDGTNGCASMTTATIGSNTTAPIAVITPSSGTLTCTTTSISLEASGGTSYVWDDNSFSANRVVSAAGTYTVTVTGSNGCTATAQAVITSTITAPPAAITPSSGTLTCTTISISLVASGGTFYVWDDNSFSATRVVSAAGTYTVTVTGSNGCTATAQAVITSTITAPPAAITPSSGTLTCTTTSISLVASGGTSYLWEDNSISATRLVSAAGTYTVTVTDETNGCTSMTTATIGSNITPPIVSITGASIICDGSSTTLTASGASTYSWIPGNLTGTTVSVSPASATTYTVTGTSTNGCTATATFTVAINTIFTASGVKTNVACKGNKTGSITLSVSGGLNVGYLWNNGIVTANRTNLYAGTYTVTISDNCKTQVLSFTITEPGTGLLLTGTKKNPNCSIGATGSATVAVSGGVGPFTYLWSNGQTNATATGLVGTAYIVTVSSTGGCTRSMTFILVAPVTISIGQIVTNPSIVAPFSGQIAAVAFGGTPNYLYLWNTVPFRTSATITGLAAGTYTVKVTDKNACTTTKSITLVNAPVRLAINLPNDLLVNATVIPNPNDGQFTVKVNAEYDAKANLHLFDNISRLVFSQSQSIVKGENLITVNMNALAKGVYYLHYDDGIKFTTIKVVIK